MLRSILHYFREVCAIRYVKKYHFLKKEFFYQFFHCKMPQVPYPTVYHISLTDV